MRRGELIERFSLDRVQPSPATLDYQKLDWMNGVYIRALSPEEFADALVRFLRDEEEARDAVQEGFLSAWRALDRFDQGSRLSTWLHRIVVNACLMRLRTRRRRPEEPIEDFLPRFEADGHQVLHPTPEWEGSAETLLARSETRAIVREAIDRLPESYRAVLLLRDIEELSTEETAEALGLSIPAVKSRLLRARLQLRERLSRFFKRKGDDAFAYM